jgi:hypothetical protein
MNNKTVWAVLVASLAVMATGAWYHAHEMLDETRSQFVTEELQPIATYLKENRALITELQSEPYTENDSGILESYLVKIRRDGVAKHADMKQRLDTRRPRSHQRETSSEITPLRGGIAGTQ